MNLRKHRWWMSAAALLAAYALAGFAGVPWLVQSQWPRLAESELGRRGSVGEVRFNPFTLRLQVQDLALAEADGSPLASVQSLVADLDWRSLLRRAWTLREVSVQAPSVTLAVAPDGTVNLARLAASWQRPADRSAAPREGTQLPRLVVERFTVAGGRLAIDDRQAGYANVLAPIEFDVQDFSTLPDASDRHALEAVSASGGRLRWRGEASLQPVRASGELVLENLSLASITPYLKPFTSAVVTDGRLGASLRYQLGYEAGVLTAQVESARLAVESLALARAAREQPFAQLAALEVEGVSADLVKRQVRVAAVRSGAGRLALRREADGTLDLARLLAERPAAQASTPSPWSLAVDGVTVGPLALRLQDETVQPPVVLTVAGAQAKLKANAAQGADALRTRVEDASLALDEVALAQAGRPVLRLARAAVDAVSIDTQPRRVQVGQLRIEGASAAVVRDAQGQIDLLARLPRAGSALPAPASGPATAAEARTAATAADGKTPDAGRATPARSEPGWSVAVGRADLSGATLDLHDQGTGVKLQLQEIALRAEGAGSDLARPVRFDASLRVREGGRLAAQGQVVPGSGRVDARLRLAQLALAPLQPLLAQHLRLKLAAGTAAADGTLSVAPASGKAAPAVRYAGSAAIDGLALNEEDGSLFLGWKRVAADRLTVATQPAGLEVPELRIVEPQASLLIAADRSFNAARLLVRAPAASGAAAGPAGARPATVPATAAAPPRAGSAAVAGSGRAPTADPFPVRIQRVRLQQARLDFEDLSLVPPFGARIYELNGVVNGLSSVRGARAQLELDGRVDEFGLARIRGALNPFAARDDTDLNLVFRNVDLVPASPYAMKFAGYRIAEGRISLDLRYRVRDGKLEGDNRIVMERLTLGERVDSPDALKLPLELAIAILKDGDGRIDLGLPVTGDLDDPQFSYAGIVWKAIGNLLTRIVTAPFRALGNLLGLSGEQLEAIGFDPGSDRLLPPEREKLRQVAQALGKREQLVLSVPGHYRQTLDGAALRREGLRQQIATAAGIPLAPGEAPGPLNLEEPAVRNTLQNLFVQRFGAAELERARQAGEDAATLHRRLLQRLEEAFVLPPDALQQLGARRSQAVLAALQEGGVQPARMSAAPPAEAPGDGTGVVPLRLELQVRR